MKLTFAALLQDTANCSGVLPSLFSTSKFVSEQSRRSLKTRGSFNYEILPDSFRKLRLSSSFCLKTPLDISRILAPRPTVTELWRELSYYHVQSYKFQDLQLSVL